MRRLLAPGFTPGNRLPSVGQAPNGGAGGVDLHFHPIPRFKIANRPRFRFNRPRPRTTTDVRSSMSDHAEHHLPTVPELQQIAHLFPGYEVAGLIASGGMGVVYKARQVSLDRDVAIKLLPREFGADAEFRNSFEAEAKAMARLNHPNLISVYDFGEVDELLFIIMEFVPGKSLFHSAHGTAIEPSEAGAIVANVCEGLAHAHEHGILHRDVKPGNILLSPKAEPKIGDFGLARPVNKEHNPDETIFGTPDTPLRK